MAENQHYVIDDGQNKIPGYTKTEVDELIESGAKAWSGTQAEYNALKQAGLLQPRSLYIITDAANLNGTAADLSFDGTAKTTKQAVDAITPEVHDYTATSNNNGVIDSNSFVTGGIPVNGYDIILVITKSNLYVTVLGYYNDRYLFVLRDRDTFNAVGSVTVDLRVVMIAK